MRDSMPEGVKSVLYWGIGIGVLALVGLVMLILFGNLSGNLGFSQSSSSFYNNTILLSEVAAQPGSVSGKVNPSLTNVIITNSTNSSQILLAATNYTVSGGYITVITGSKYNGTNVNVSATVFYDKQEKIDTDNLITNYSKSVTNTASQFPTVGTIVGIALLLVILIGVLVFAIKKLMGVTGSSVSSGRSSRFDGSSSAEIG